MQTRLHHIVATCMVWLLLTVSILPQSAYAQVFDSSTVNQQLENAIIAQVEELNELSEIEVTDFELSDEPSHLYLGFLDISGRQKQAQALEATALITGQSVFTVRDILRNGTADLGMPQEQTLQIVQRVKSVYNEEVAIAELTAELVTSQLFFERYSNGVDDAEFDLLDDLAEIHDLLFTGTPRRYIDSDPSQRSRNPYRSGHLQRLQDLAESRQRQVSAGLAEGDLSAEGDGQPPTETPGETPGQNPAETTSGGSASDPAGQPAEPGSGEDADLEPFHCPVDPELEALLETFTDSQTETATGNGSEGGNQNGNQNGSTPSSNQPDATTGSSDSGEQSDTSSGGTASGGNTQGATGNGDEQDGQAAYASRQLANLFTTDDNRFGCEDGLPYCIEVIKEFARTKNYFPGDQSCTACRLSAMNQLLSENVLNKNLSPGKVTGNFGELAECKEAYIRLPLDLNITFEGRAVFPDQQAGLAKELTQPEPPKSRITLQAPSEDAQLRRTLAIKGTNITGAAQNVQQQLEAIRAEIKIQGQAIADQQSINFYESIDQNLVPQIREFNAQLAVMNSKFTQLLAELQEFMNNPSCNA